MRLTYTNLDLFIEKVAYPPGYKARVTHHEHGTEATVIFAKPFSDEDLQRVLSGMSEGPRDFRLRSESSERDLAIRIGRRMFDSVFSRETLRIWTRASDHVTEQVGLRIRVRPEGEIATWPWELLHDGKDFVALSPKTPIVRYPQDTEPIQPLKVALPLRVLVVTSIPSNLEQISIRREYENIDRALAKIKHVEVGRLENPTFRVLGSRLKEGRYHVFHFIGHGAFDRQAGKGTIALSDEHGVAAPVDGVALGGLLKGREIRLAILNACQGAFCSTSDITSGVAQRLIDLGIPAVIAMQQDIADQSAVTFAQHLYESLAEGEPVDEAISEARNGVDVESQKKGTDWATPVLLLRSPDGDLFDVIPPGRRSLILPILLALAVLGVLVMAGLFFPKVHRTLVSQGTNQGCPSPRAVPDMELVRVPGGALKDFCLSVYEVTQKQWADVMGPNTIRGGPLDDDLPVTRVTYEEVLEFVAKLNEKEGEEVFRLPSEGEWELAAQSPGGGWNCKEGAGADHFVGLAKVGSLEPNQLGLYDMLGNAWEWVASDSQDLSLKGQRARRGGSYDSTDTCKVDFKSTVDSRRNKDTGFRVLREIHK